MQWINLQTFWYRYRRVEPYLPKKLQGALKQMTGRNSPNETQLDQIKLLGEDIGLSENEVLASLGRPSSPMGVDGRQRTTIYFTMLVAIMVIVWGALYIWAILDPETAPIKTYVPGTFYGTIKPKDFAFYGPSIV